MAYKFHGSFIDEFQRMSDELYNLAIESGLDADIPLEGWTMSHLISHLSNVYHRMNLRIGATESPQFTDQYHTGAEAISRFKATRDALVQRLTEVDSATHCWNWTGSNQNKHWIERRIAHETAIHLLDALASIDISKAAHYSFDGNFAIDGVEEFRETFLARLEKDFKGPESDVTIRLTADDSSFSEAFTIGQHHIHHATSHTNADFEYISSPSNLYKFVWNRWLSDGDNEASMLWKAYVTV
ncbi:MAG: maleylpyruvate isomerase N-terminal domain-containing protein [Actinomycetota bacterium]|nr:maleylpyruvate isomerase N-terminal domain-containing protein [Actinomycetota bacterium]